MKLFGFLQLRFPKFNEDNWPCGKKMYKLLKESVAKEGVIEQIIVNKVTSTILAGTLRANILLHLYVEGKIDRNYEVPVLFEEVDNELGYIRAESKDGK